MKDKRIAAVLEPDNYPSLEDEPLTPSEQDVKAHWQRFLPKMSAELKAQGPKALDLAVRKAAWLTEYHVALAQAENPGLSSLQAEETFRNQWTYLPPEPRTTQGTKPPTTT